MTTIKAVAQLAGVSTATVSRVLSRPEMVVQDTRERVRKAVAALGYAPNSAAQSLRMLRSAKILVMVPDVSNPFFSEVLRGAEETAQAAGYSVLLGDTRNDPRLEDQLAQMLLRREADGIVFLGHRLPATLDRLRATPEAMMPVVNACDFSPDLGVSSAHIDNRRAAREVMDHLYDLGHRDIGVIAGPSESHLTRARLDGVQDAAAGRGLIDRLRIDYADYAMEDGAARAGAMLTGAAAPTGLFCFSDELAIGALRACRDRGLDCPRDRSIVGFDDIRYASYFDPPLTTIRQPMAALGQAAIELLLGTLKGERKVRNLVLDHELVLRASTGPAPHRS